MSQELLEVTTSKGITRLTMQRGANAINEPLMEALRAAIGELREGGAPPLLLASAHPTIFSPGWDLKRLYGAEREEVRAFLGLFEDLILGLFSYPGPTAAAVGGHAIAGGCLLAMACDLRIMAAGRARIGLSEINLGVPVPAGCVRMLSARLGAAAAELILQGDGVRVQRAVQLGVVQGVAVDRPVDEEAESELYSLQLKSAHAYAEAKRMLYAESWEAARRDAAAGAATFLDCWLEEDTQDRIAGVVRRLES
jgi:Delta3-Delta2-enoyl-CoA isomerase